VQRGPDRNLVLESRGLLEGQPKKVGAKFGSQGGCNSSVVVRAAHILISPCVVVDLLAHIPTRYQGTRNHRPAPVISDLNR
jgi:hypothetical protein